MYVPAAADAPAAAAGAGTASQGGGDEDGLGSVCDTINWPSLANSFNYF